MITNVSLLIETERDGENLSLFVSDAKMRRMSDNTYKISFDESEGRYGRQRTDFIVEAKDTVTVISDRCRYFSALGNVEFRSGQRQYLHNPERAPLTIGLTTGNIRSTLSDDGGKVEIEYTLDINSAYSVSNKLKLYVRRNKPRRRKTKEKTERTNI